mmetsp:Transcript_6405/g.15171  ORF Transcript_6405/g.15171 Transcript_6405/m.15171 type:complete len:242 (+) Transcript_6405:256-981(+)
MRASCIAAPASIEVRRPGSVACSAAALSDLSMSVSSLMRASEESYCCGISMDPRPGRSISAEPLRPMSPDARRPPSPEERRPSAEERRLPSMDFLRASFDERRFSYPSGSTVDCLRRMGLISSVTSSLVNIARPSAASISRLPNIARVAADAALSIETRPIPCPPWNPPFSFPNAFPLLLPSVSVAAAIMERCISPESRFTSKVTSTSSSMPSISSKNTSSICRPPVVVLPLSTFSLMRSP